MSNLQKRKEGGFTIIEVLIVLAIAGLIMLIVFLAVPALQRNSRNTSLKNDASSISSAISEYLSNNDGVMPATSGTVTKTGALVTVGASGSAQATAKVNGGTTVTQATTVPPTLAANNIQVVIGRTCANVASSRQAAVAYAVETTAGTNVLCIET